MPPLTRGQKKTGAKRSAGRLKSNGVKNTTAFDTFDILPNIGGIHSVLLQHQIIEESSLSDYVKNLLLYTLSIHCEELLETMTLGAWVDVYDRKNLWRNFGMLDELFIPDKAIEYLEKIFPTDEPSAPDTGNAQKRFGRVEQFTELLNDSCNARYKPRSKKHPILSQRLSFDVTGKWLKPDQYKNAKEMERFQGKGFDLLNQHISKRLDAGEDVRFLKREEFKELDEAFPLIINGIRDTKGDFITLNSALLLQRAWRLAYDAYHDLDSPFPYSESELDARKQMLLEAAIREDFLKRLYSPLDRVRLGEYEHLIHRFCTLHSTTDELRTSLQTFRSASLDIFSTTKKRKRKAVTWAENKRVAFEPEEDVVGVHQPESPQTKGILTTTSSDNISDTDMDQFLPSNNASVTTTIPTNEVASNQGGEVESTEAIQDKRRAPSEPIFTQPEIIPEDRRDSSEPVFTQHEVASDQHEAVQSTQSIPEAIRAPSEPVLNQSKNVESTVAIVDERKVHKKTELSAKDPLLDHVLLDLRSLAERRQGELEGPRIVPSVLVDPDSEDQIRQKLANDIFCGYSDLAVMLLFKDLTPQETKLLEDIQERLEIIKGEISKTAVAATNL